MTVRYAKVASYMKIGQETLLQARSLDAIFFLRSVNTLLPFYMGEVECFECFLQT